MPDLTDESRVLMLEWQELSANRLESYVSDWQSGRLSLADFERLFKVEIRDLYVAAAWTARGSVAATSQADYGRIGRMLRDQYGYTHEFFQEIEADKLSLAQIRARARLYVESAGQALERIGIDEAGLPRLPHYPKDGSTPCKMNDKCILRKQKVENGWDIYWELNPAEHCPVCRRRAAGSPLRVRFGEVVNSEAWE